MLKYTVKRLAQSLVTILLIATIVFLLMRCLPTDYYFTEEQLMKFTEEQKYAALEAAGLTDPIGTQLLHFYNDLLHLDFGTSRRIQNGASVVKVIGKKFGVSMRLGLISAGISLVVGVLLLYGAYYYFSNRTVENKLKADIKEMYAMYGIDGGEGNDIQ